MTTDNRPLIMVTNDDGVQSRGIAALAGVASRFGHVIVVAPAVPQSGKSSAITTDSPLYIASHPPIGTADVYSVSGTPVDCVKLGLHAIFDRKPDLLLSGINHGSNAAVNNIYSGTMGAAMEGCIVGIPSIGFSLLDHSADADFTAALPLIGETIRRVLALGIPEDICLNINFPATPSIEGIKAVRAAQGYWSEEYADMATPSGKPFYWLTGKFHNCEPDNPDTDEYWLAHGWGTVVPIRPDQTAPDAIPAIKEIFG